MEVARDKGIREEEFFTMNGDESSFEANVSGFDAFDFFAGQYQTSLVLVSKGVIKTSSFIGSKSSHSAYSMPYRARGIKFF